MVSFNYLQTFVYKCGRFNGNFFAHFIAWVFESLSGCDARECSRGFAIKWSAGTGNDYFFNFFVWKFLEDFENCVVFGIERDEGGGFVEFLL